ITSISGALVNYPGGTLTLDIEYCRDGPNYRSGFKFQKVRACRHKAESYCSRWEIESSDCKLVEVLKSSWIEELKSKSIHGEDDNWVMHHFMFFFPDEGCYEVIAESWEVLPEKKIS
ncbi:MAG: hypothetical protein MI754_12375, partial [Chromatiales bacterium]|nr:hypothetical protein [Chromatiales bacterium]